MTAQQLKTAYQATGLSFIGISFQHALEVPCIRISLECAVKASTKGKAAPVQRSLI